MSTFESKVLISRPVSEVYNFLADMSNHRQLMPATITDWESTTDLASFNIPNITQLSLQVAERVPGALVKIIPAEKPPFDMELQWQLTGTAAGAQVIFIITADLNMFMKMLASGPLQNLANEETANLAALLS